MVSDPLWVAILEKIQDIEKQGYQPSSRSVAYTHQYNENHPKSMITIYKAYASDDTEHCVRQVFVIEAREPSNYERAKNIHVSVEGPYDDSDDVFWQGNSKADKNRVFLVTDTWNHYTVDQDRRDPGPGDGFGGRLFTVEYTGTAEFLRQKRIKFEKKDDKIVIFSRNVWSQGTIPPKHRHFWSINAKILPEKPILLDFNDELLKNTPNSPKNQQ